MTLRFHNIATYEDPSGSVRILGCPYCGWDEGLQTDLKEQYAGCAYCKCCERLIDEDELHKLSQALEDLDATAEQFADRILALAEGVMVPSPFGVDPIDSQPEVYHHGPVARAEVA